MTILDHALTESPDPVDALIGSVDIDPIDDIDAAIYLQVSFADTSFGLAC